MDDLRDVRRAIWDVRRKWFDLGLELDIPLSDLNNIRARYKDASSDCLIQILVEWLKRSSPPPTWRALIAALRDQAVDEEALAEVIGTKYCF